MRKKVKIIITTFCLVLSLFIFTGVSVHASEYDDIQKEVTSLISQGKL